MPKLSSPLNQLRISAPCPADWDQMFSFEDKRVRFCSQCNLNVYNLSGMSRQEAEALITKTEGRLCVRFYRRVDGSVLTQNCPVGLKAIKRRVAWVAQVVLGMVLSFVSGFGLYILHLGTKPYPMLKLLNKHFTFKQEFYKTGVLITVRPETYPQVRPILGEVILETRQSDRGTPSKAKGQE
jgi:hypothetical protein